MQQKHHCRIHEETSTECKRQATKKDREERHTSEH